MPETMDEMPDAAETSDDVSGVDTGHVPREVLLSPRDQEMLAAFDELKQRTLRLAERLAALSRSRPDEVVAAAVKDAQQELDAFAPLLARLLAHDAEALQQLHDQRRFTDEVLRDHDQVNGRLTAIVSSPPFRAARQVARLGKLALAPLTALSAARRRATIAQPAGSTPPADATAPALPSVAKVHESHGLHNPYADVDNRGTAFDIFRNWVTVFHVGAKRRGATFPLVNDQVAAIYELHRVFPLAGKTVLELGPLEGANTKQMLDLGARAVTGIESNRESFLKCLVAGNEIPLPAARFVFGDLNEVLQREEFATAQHDLCLASGVLYHMEDPLGTIDRITRTAPAVYVWSHVAGERAPSGEWLDLSDGAGRSYRGRKNVYRKTTHIGGVGRQAIWLTPESLRQAFVDRGFRLLDMGSLQNVNGDAIKFLATRS